VPLRITRLSLQELLPACCRADRVVFDLDGTVYDTRDFERPALASVVEWLRSASGASLEGLTEALWRRRERSRDRPGLFDDLLVEWGLPQAWGAECARRFHGFRGGELARAASLRPLMIELRARGARLALVSNGYAEVQDRKVHLLGLGDMLDVRVYCDPREPQQLKPAPWAWSQLEQWRAGASTIFIGDGAVDAEFAASVGVPFVHFSFRNPVYAD
jgi:FMN phosphatase YigB (HAD superfamily)